MITNLIDNPQSQNILNFAYAHSELLEAMSEDQPTAVYLKVDTFIMKLLFNYRLVSLYPSYLLK